MRLILLCYRGEDQVICLVDLILVNCMTHPGVDLFCHSRIHFLQDVGGGIDPFHGNMRVGIAGADEYGCTSEVAGIIFRIYPVSDEAAGEGYDTPEAGCIAGDKLQCQTGALGETSEIDIL